MRYLVPIFLAWCFIVKCFPFSFQKHSLSTVIYVIIIVASLLCIFLSFIQNGKTVQGSEISEIKAKQNHTFRSLFDAFLELQGINTSERNTLFLLLCVKRKTQPTLIITSEKPAVLNVFSIVIFFS